MLGRPDDSGTTLDGCQADVALQGDIEGPWEGCGHILQPLWCSEGRKGRFSLHRCHRVGEDALQA